MPTKKFKVKTELHGSLRDHPKSGLRTTKEEAHFPEEGSGVCGVDQLHRDAEGDETRGGGCASGEKGLEDIPGGGGKKLLQGQKPREVLVVSSFSFCYTKNGRQLEGH